MSSIDFECITVTDPQMQKMLEVAKKASKSCASILISGERGTGKTSLAKYIHHLAYPLRDLFIIEAKDLSHHSGDSFKNFLKGLTCKTLIIENIDALSIHLQSELKTSLECMNNWRLIATTKREYSNLIEFGNLLEDLFYKITVVHLHLPKLSQRMSDLIALATFYKDNSAVLHGKSDLKFSFEAIEKLTNYKWPGNLRELENIIERSVILVDGDTISSEEIVLNESHEVHVSVGTGVSLSEMEKMLILQTLKITSQNRTKAAQMLGISIRTLRNKINEYKMEGVI